MAHGMPPGRPGSSCPRAPEPFAGKGNAWVRPANAPWIRRPVAVPGLPGEPRRPAPFLDRATASVLYSRQPGGRLSLASAAGCRARHRSFQGQEWRCEQGGALRTAGPTPIRVHNGYHRCRMVTENPSSENRNPVRAAARTLDTFLWGMLYYRKRVGGRGGLQAGRGLKPSRCS